ncbi:MAG: hypothetical protein Q8922_06590 [Bacteroidota bacterium]|nr:hypothetical protein [Bacteroidota bacterium]MDP4232737.1 hypothetical protein [Bacteroidota bacterium]MDP4244053.1 hypothetical protein [Bacteroidota bacterium]MDP4287587.1 hypothetical protein [Bacteroidota bacterium]
MIRAYSILSCISFLLLNPSLNAQPIASWQHCFGGMGTDEFGNMIRTSDGGFVAIGQTTSNDGDVRNNHSLGLGDVWVVKLTKDSTIQWKTALGGSDWDNASNIIQTKDGGYAIAGLTLSNDGDVKDKHALGGDAWIIRLSPAGTIIWSRTLGGFMNDAAYAIQQASDSSILVAGFTYSSDGDFVREPSHTFGHAWAAMLDDSGRTKWIKTYGGNGDEGVYDMARSEDGGFVLAGWTTSEDGDVSGQHGMTDAWVLKINDTGAIIWQRCLGGSDEDIAYGITASSDGGYAIACVSSSIDDDVVAQHGNSDAWIVKLNGDGSVDWAKSYGGSDYDGAGEITQTSDGGYAFTGYADSGDGDVSGVHGGSSGPFDLWVVRIDKVGKLIWQYAAGGSGDDYGNGIVRLTDSTFFVAGASHSNDGDVSGLHGVDSEDSWLVRVGLPVPSLVVQQQDAPSVSPFRLSQPSIGVLSVAYDLTGSTRVSLDLFDVMGCVRIMQRPEFQSPGSHVRIINTIGLPTGNYFIRLTEAGHSTTQPVSITE